MSFYFSIIGTKDNPLFEHEFGTSKQGGDGVPRFRDDARRMNPFIVHSSLDILDDLQWSSGAMSVLPSPFRRQPTKVSRTGTSRRSTASPTPTSPPS